MRYKEPETEAEAVETIRLLESGEMDTPKNADMGPAWQGLGAEEDEAMTREEAVQGLRAFVERRKAERA